MTCLMVGNLQRKLIRDWHFKAELEPSPRVPFERFATIVKPAPKNHGANAYTWLFAATNTRPLAMMGGTNF